MTTRTEDAPRTSFVALAGEVISSTGELANVHGSQLRAEVKSHLEAAILTLGALAMAASLTVLGLAFGLIAIVQVLQHSANLSPPAAWGIVAGVCIVIGVVLSIVMWRAFQRIRVVPYESFRSIGESLQWITRR